MWKLAAPSIEQFWCTTKFTNENKIFKNHLMDNRLTYENIPSFLEKNCAVKSTVQKIFRNLRENHQKFEKVTDQDLLALSSVFGETFEKALEILEENRVTYYYTRSNIGIYQIEGNSNQAYTIFPSVNYCPCPSYRYKVSGGNHILCKHVLASILADVINRRYSIEVTDEHLKNLLLVSVSLKIKMNDREDWHNGNAYVEQVMYSLPRAQPTFGMPSNNWAHVPPQTMPWGLPPESQPSIVRFTAGDFNSHPIKRKYESDIDIPPAKMLVTEEKMAAHMRGLHISDVEPRDVPAIKEEPMETERLPRLVISEEIKNLKTESLIPESILKKLGKPEMALVLWQPPAADLESKFRELKKLSTIKEKNKKNATKKEKEDKEMEIETEADNNNRDSVFRPIDPVPMPQIQNQYFQPVPQCHGYSPFS